MNRQQRRFAKRSNRKPRAVRKEKVRRRAIAKTQKKYILKAFRQEIPAIAMAIILIIVNMISFDKSVTASEAVKEPVLQEEVEELTIETVEKTVIKDVRFVASRRELPYYVVENLAEDKSDTETEKINATDDDVMFLSRLITAEVGMFYTTLSYEEAVEAAILTGGVVRNRMDIKQLSLQEIVYAPGQYADPTLEKIEAEVDPNLWDNSIILIARAILEHNEKEISIELIGESIEIPKNLYYQSQQPLGTGTYREIGNEYFCYK